LDLTATWLTLISTENLSYTGLDILQALEGARNYNALLTQLVVAHTVGVRRLLDFGAGIGTFSKLLRSRGYLLTCIEPDRYLAGHLEKEGFETYADLSPINDGSVEFAFSLNVFEHIRDDAGALAELTRKLADGGMLFLYVPAFECLWTSLDDKVEHQRRYTKYTLKRLVLSQGLEVLSIAYADSLGFAAALLFKALGNNAGRLTPKSIRFYDRLLMPVSRMLDHVCHPIVGKNVWALCRKPLSTNK
jgi:SAM-dependent methyltransferase